VSNKKLDPWGKSSLDLSFERNSTIGLRKKKSDRVEQRPVQGTSTHWTALNLQCHSKGPFFLGARPGLKPWTVGSPLDSNHWASNSCSLMVSFRSSFVFSLFLDVGIFFLLV